MRLNTTGEGNVAIGRVSLEKNTTGKSNVAIGYESLCSNTIARFNTAVGYQTLSANTTGEYNVSIGYKSLFSNTIDPVEGFSKPDISIKRLVFPEPLSPVKATLSFFFISKFIFFKTLISFPFNW